MLSRLAAVGFLVLFLSTGLAPVASANVLPGATLVGAALGTVNEGQTKSATFDVKVPFLVGDVTYSVAPCAPFQLSPQSGSARGISKVTFTATILSNAAPGEYESRSCHILFKKNGSQQDITPLLTATVNGYSFTLSASTIDFGSAAKTETRDLILTLRAVGISPVNFQIQPGAGLTATPATGSVANSPVTVKVGFSASVPNGPFNGVITVVDKHTNLTRTVNIKASLHQ